ncbi:MAG: phasin family protein [Beijerinckiaceae bacterium]
MKKPVSLARVGMLMDRSPARSLPPIPVPEAAKAANTNSASPAPSEPPADLVRSIETAAAVSDAVDQPLPDSLAILLCDLWLAQGQAVADQMLALAKTRTVADAIALQGAFVRQQVEAAQENMRLLGNLSVRYSGIDGPLRIPVTTLALPFAGTMCKPA